MRLTPKEKIRQDERANITGLSASEYMRRRIFDGTIVAYTDLKIIGELRRIGGLPKHNFETLRQANMPPDIVNKQEDALRKLVRVAEKISLALEIRRRNNGHES